MNSMKFAIRAIQGIRTLVPTARSSSSGLHLGQALNGAGETCQSCAVEDKVDADGQSNEVGAGCGPSGQEVDAENNGDESRKDRPPPSRKLNYTRTDSQEQPSHDEEGGKQHGHSCRACVRVANQEVSGHPTDDGIQQVQKESMPTKGPNRIYEPQHS